MGNIAGIPKNNLVILINYLFIINEYNFIRISIQYSSGGYPLAINPSHK